MSRTLMSRLGLVLLCVWGCGFEAQAAWKAGVGRAKITPEQPQWMAGYGSRDHESEGTLHDLWAKALTLVDGSGKRVVLVTFDLCGIGRDLSDAMCAALKEKHGLERAQIALNCSHTHTGPVVGSNLRSMYFMTDAQDQVVKDYTAALIRKVVAAVSDAIASEAPADVLEGQGRTTFAVNRRTNKEPDVPKLREDGLLKGPNDHAVPVLAVKGADGKLRAIVAGYACHSTVLSFYQWSGDYPGFYQLALEKAHPGAQAMFVAGCGGDQNPLPRRTVELAEQYGGMLADSVEQVLSTGLQPVPDQLTTKYLEVPLGFAKLPTKADLLADEMSTDRYRASRAKLLLRQSEKAPLPPTYAYPIHTWTVGNRRIVFLGGEVVVDYALRIKQQFGGDSLWVAGYSNDVMAYIPSLRVLKEGGYEGGGAMLYYGLPSEWDEKVEETIIEGVKRSMMD
jgi:neutral ceramidase